MRYYGITQDPITQDYAIVMNYYDTGSLTHYLTNDFYDINWSDKLTILGDVLSGLINIHKKNIIHKNIHSGNILLKNQTNYIEEIVLSDVGINKSSTDDNTIYGIIPYMAPEIFREQTYTRASDMYSLGMIMWELMTGRRPFWDRKHDAELINEICNGLLPPIASNAPKGYIELMKECWNSDPKERPMAIEAFRKLKDIKENEWDNTTKIIKSSDIGPIADKSGAIYKSRCLSDMIKSAAFSRNQSITSGIDKRKFKNNQEDNFDNDNNFKRTKIIEDNNAFEFYVEI
ncbi:kinase-like domain-containing protein [Glomus cerebriforme]|uniref:Kinase-like domain-containing protein n=1 Tax=Glomus cerebriforme TaxID=658196 RepID=A0A397T8F1_9GLOM|nr:kinase-like domain-containing protein [Glomus cerebriforme]